MVRASSGRRWPDKRTALEHVRPCNFKDNVVSTILKLCSTDQEYCQWRSTYIPDTYDDFLTTPKHKRVTSRV
jgi:hypothetical protein